MYQQKDGEEEKQEYVLFVTDAKNNWVGFSIDMTLPTLVEMLLIK